MSILRFRSCCRPAAIALLTALAGSGAILGASPETAVALWGPLPVERAAGPPVTATFPLDVPPLVHAPFRLLIENGTPEGDRRVSSAWIELDNRAVAGPADLNQTVARLEREVDLAAESTLAVTLASQPGSFLTLTLTGTIDPDVELAATVSTPGDAGDLLVLPDLAELTVPEGAAGAAEITLTALDSPFVDLLAAASLPSFVPLDAPEIRIKASLPLTGPVFLAVPVPDLAGAMPTDREPWFAAVIHSSGDEEEIDDLIPIGGGRCGDESVCVTLRPEWFSKINPLDPLDPVVTVTLGYLGGPAVPGRRPWEVTGVAPAGALQVPANQPVTVSARLRLKQDVTFASGTPVRFSAPSAGFFYANGELHGGVDLPVLVGTPVHAAIPAGTSTARSGWVPYQGRLPDRGFLCPSGKRVFGSYGYLVELLHGQDAFTRYGHLKEPGLAMGLPTTAGVPIGLSGKTGKACGPHLHFELSLVWDSQPHRVDPWPYLNNDMGLFLSDPAHPVKLGLRIGMTPLHPPRVVTATPFDFTQTVSFAGLPPGQYRMELWLDAARLGGEHQVAAWTVQVLDEVDLRIVKAGTGGGTVTSSPAGIQCGTVCVGRFPRGTAMTLTATPDSNSRFAGWGGDCSGTAPSTSVALAGDTQCHATFDPAYPPYSLTFTQASCQMSWNTLSVAVAGIDGGPYGSWDRIVGIYLWRDGQLGLFAPYNSLFDYSRIIYRRSALTRDWSASASYHVRLPSGTGPVQVQFNASTPFVRANLRVPCQ